MMTGLFLKFVRDNDLKASNYQTYTLRMNVTKSASSTKRQPNEFMMGSFRISIFIPRDEFTDEMILFLKSIGVKANLFSSLDDLEVMDEDYLSDSSFVLQ